MVVVGCPPCRVCPQPVHSKRRGPVVTIRKLFPLLFVAVAADVRPVAVVGAG